MAVDRPTFSESWYRVAQLRPGLRTSVQVHRQHFRGQMWHVLQDPGSNQYFRLSESAYAFVAMLDGQRPVAQVWKICNEQLGDDAPTQGEVIQLLGQLYTSNLLQADVPPDAEGLLSRYSKRRSREIRSYLSNLLFIRVPIFDPDAMLNRWVSVFGKAFTKWGLMIWAIIVIAGLYSIGGRMSDLASRANGVLDPGNLLFLYISFAFVKLFHEMGHAFSCKKFGLSSGGGEVHTIGIMFLVFTPMPYVDASSSWVLRNKWQRACVGAGGMYVELAVAAVAAIIWSHTATATAVNAICYNVMFIASVSTLLFNANPLLRYDGYYILSDYLEIPNLAQRSKQHLYYLVRKYIYGVKKARPVAHGSGERVWFPIYGLASTVYRVFICTAILLFVADRFFLVGVIMAIAAMVTWVGVPLVGFLRYIFTSTELARSRPRALLSTAGFLLAVFVVIGGLKFPHHVRAEGIVEPERVAVIHAGSSGFVVRARPSGEIVDAGAVLVECENRQLLTRQKHLQAQREELQAQRRIARQEEQATVQVFDRKIKLTDRQLARASKELAELKIRAPFQGSWLSPQTDRMGGVYLKKGDTIGMVADLGHIRIRAIAGQRVAGPLGVEGSGDVEIRVKGRADLELTGRLVEIFPAGTNQLFSQAQSFQAGGSVQTASDDPKAMRSAEKFFEIRVQPDPQGLDKVRLLQGQRVDVRFTLKSKPLLVQWWQSLSQMVQQRFQI